MGSLGPLIEDVEGQSTSLSLSSYSNLPLLSLNHVSFVCKSVSRSVRFYEDILGFMLIRRPSSFNFQGAWLFNYGIGIHLLESDHVPGKNDGKINPKDNHISFQCSDMNLLKKKLQEKNVDYVTAIVEEGGIQVDQMFFHDPDGYMIEICNCDNLPVLPLSSCPLKLPSTKNGSSADHRLPPSMSAGQSNSEIHCSTKFEKLMMDSFLMDMINISF